MHTNNPPSPEDALFLALVERWIEGSFTRQDEEALRALVASDAFRREAWQGFSALPADEHQAVLKRLRDQYAVSERRERRTGYRRVAIAAAVALIVGAVYWWRSSVLSSEVVEGQPETEYLAAEETPSSSSEELASRPSPTLVAPPASKSGGESAAARTRSLPSSPPLTAAPMAQDSPAAPSLRGLADGRTAKATDHAPAGAVLSAAEPVPSAASTRANSRSVQPIRVEPSVGWQAFLDQYRQAPLFRHPEEYDVDSLRLQLYIRSDSTPVLLSIDPPVKANREREIERFLQQYRWIPAEQRGILHLPLRQ